MIYAVLNANGDCIDHIVWDGQTQWQPPEGCTAVADPDRSYVVLESEQPVEEDPLESLTFEQKQALISLLQNDG